MYSICITCYEIFHNSTLKRCPKATCAGDVLHIDELMIPAIITLNKKGYKTDGCCSSHEFGFAKTPGMYGADRIWIHFEDDILTLPSIPEGFKLRPIGSGNGDGRSVVRIEQEDPIWYATPGVVDRQRRTFDGIINLTKWAENLPERISAEHITLKDIYDISFGLVNDIPITVAKEFKVYISAKDSSSSVIDIRHKDTLITSLLFHPEDTDDKNDRDRVVSILFKNKGVEDKSVRTTSHTINLLKYCMPDKNEADIIVAVLTEFFNKYKK